MNRIVLAQCWLLAALFILLVLPVPMVDGYYTEFRLNGSVSCSMRHHNFRVRLLLEEEDNMSNDLIAEFGVKQATHYRMPIEMVGYQSGDGAFDEFYEVATFIIHDCSRDGIYRKIRNPWPAPVPTSEKVATHEIDIDLTNHGEKVAKTFFPN